jgi:HK97 family phage prohead protease
MSKTIDDHAREMRAFSFDVRATGDDGTIEGYGSVFNTRDAYDDSIAPGAFKASLEAHKGAGTMPAMLWQHDAAEPVGVWTEMSEDASGLRVKGRIATDTAKGRDVLALLRMKAISGLSIGFVATDKTWDDKTGVRTLRGVDLWEVSLVTFPANRSARLTSVKNAEIVSVSTIRQAEEVLRDAGFTDGAAKAFVARVKTIAIDERDARVATESTIAAANRLLRSLNQSHGDTND